MSDVNPIRRLRSVADASPSSRSASPDDELAQLLKRSGKGDEAAFGLLYDVLAPLIHGVIRKVLRDPAMSEEVTQEVFLEIWRLAPRYDESRGSARSWASTIAHRRAVDRVRSEQSRRERDDRDAQLQEIPHDSVVEAATDRLEGARVRQALDGLSSVQREAVRLAYYGGHTYREVAVLLDLPEGTVKTRIRDGLIKLRDQLEVTS